MKAIRRGIFLGVTLLLVSCSTGNSSQVSLVDRGDVAASFTSTSTAESLPSASSSTSVPVAEPPTTTTPVLLAAPPELDEDHCRIPQKNKKRGVFSTGFPVEVTNLSPEQEISVVAVAIDWVDAPGTDADIAIGNSDIETFATYLEEVSEGRLSFEITDASTWYRLPEPTTAYPQDQRSSPNIKVAQAAIDIADSDFDFQLYDIVIFVLPQGAALPSGQPQTPQNFADFHNFNEIPAGSSQRLMSDEGWIRNYLGAGLYFDDSNRPAWSYYIHETGHMFGLPDWYLREGNMLFSPYQENPLMIPIGPMSTWSMMSTQDGPSRTFDAWARWLMGWITTEQVYCLDHLQVHASDPFDMELLALDQYGPGTKALFIRTGENSGLGIESRRPVGLDENLVQWRRAGRNTQGIIVYRIDTTKGDAGGTLSLVTPIGRSVSYLPSTPPAIDALFALGDVAEVDGIRIELIRSDDSDVVRLSSLLTTG